MSLAAEALDEAAEMLATLPQTAPARLLQARLIALGTVLVGTVREKPRLTDAQQTKLANEALALALEAVEFKRRIHPGDE